MRYLLILSLLLTSCSSSPKTYSEPKVGMEYVDFMRLCGNSMYDDTKTFTNSKGTVTTFTMKDDNESVVWVNNSNANRRDRQCWGTFIFVENKLDSISR